MEREVDEERKKKKKKKRKKEREKWREGHVGKRILWFSEGFKRRYLSVRHSEQQEKRHGDHRIQLCFLFCV
jgi:hypothetical protein